MANPSVPGFNVAFPSQQFKDGIRFAMQMGTPALADGTPDPNKRAVFTKKSPGKQYFKDGVEIAKPRTDRDGRPFDPSIQVVDVAPAVVTDADVAVEVQQADADELPVGNFRGTKAIVTVLEDDYIKIDGAREMRYNGDRYLYGYEPEVDGMFDVNAHTLIFYAVDET